MTTFIRKPRICAVCGSFAQYAVTASTNRFGSPDLDLRPPEMERSTMMTWVQECPVCGYAASNVSAPTGVTKEWLQSERYRNCEGIPFGSGLAKSFYRSYMINRQDGRGTDAFYALLHAAWCSDDNDEQENAERCRRLALEHIGDLIASGQDGEERDTFLVVKADLMRRAGLFEELWQEYGEVRFDSDLLNRIIAFQLRKSEARDRGCYTVEDTGNC